MTVIRRTRKTSGFVLISNEALSDARLSLRARGVLATVLSWPPGRALAADSLAQRVKEGRKAISTALKELEDAGYARYHRRQNERGQWCSEWEIGDAGTLLAEGSTPTREEVSTTPSAQEGSEEGASVDHAPPIATSIPVDGESEWMEQFIDDLPRSLHIQRVPLGVLEDARPYISGGVLPSEVANLVSSEAPEFIKSREGFIRYRLQSLSWVQLDPKFRAVIENANSRHQIPWCGQCDRSDFRFEDLGDTVVRCSRCNPDAIMAAASDSDF